MPDTFICDAIRTPIGKLNGSSSVRADDLAAIPTRALKARIARVDWEAVDDTLLGCANQAGEDNRNVARTAVLLGGLPDVVPGSTVNRLCGSGLNRKGGAIAFGHPLGMLGARIVMTAIEELHRTGGRYARTRSHGRTEGNGVAIPV